VLRFSPSIAPGPPSGANSHVSDARSGSGTVATRLWQCSTGSLYLVRRLQSVLNAAARLIYRLRPYDHISDALAALHWLRVPGREQYKIAMLAFKVLHDSVPGYLGPLVAVADLPGRRALRSARTSRLVAPPIKLSTVGSRAFPVAAAQVWNGLPEAVVLSSSLQTSRRQLKTHLFQLSYPHLIIRPFDWHRYSGLCSNVRNLVHSKNLCLLAYLLIRKPTPGLD